MLNHCVASMTTGFLRYFMRTTIELQQKLGRRGSQYKAKRQVQMISFKAPWFITLNMGVVGQDKPAHADRLIKEIALIAV